MKSFLIVILGAWAILGIALWATTTTAAPTWVFATIAGITVLVGAAVSQLARRRREKATGSAHPDSIEAVRAATARAATFIDVLVAATALTVAFAFVPWIPPAVSVCVLLLIAVIDFWIRYAVLRRS